MLLKSGPNLKVGKHTYYNGEIKLDANKDAKIHIGSFCAIAPNLKIKTVNHDYRFPAIQGMFYKNFFESQHPGEIGTPSKIRTKGDVVIGNDVWIGEDVLILSGVTIGNGCCIGARSVVVHDLEPYTICVGTPCKAVKKRYSDEIISFLEKIKWWSWTDEKIKKNKQFFMTDLTSTTVKQLEKIIVNS